MNIHLAKRKTASVRIEIEQITVSRFERRNTGICVKSAVRTFCCWGKRSEAEGEIFTKAVYIRGDSAEYYANLTYDKDCVLILLPFVLLIALNVGKPVKSIKQYRSEKRAEREAAAAEQKRETNVSPNRRAPTAKRSKGAKRS